jgi:peptidoglycan hydrolase CwlO-like protein
LTWYGIISTSIKKIKTMPKQIKLKSLIVTSRSLLLVVLAVAIGATGSTSYIVHADQYDDQINALRAQNNNTQSSINSLASQAGSYQAAIGQLQMQISGVQAAINTNVARQTSLQQQIVDAEAKLKQQRAYLAADIKAMYVDGQLSTIEQLATSKNLSDYVDKEEYRTSVQNKINSLVKEISAQQAALKLQKEELDRLVVSQQQQRNELAAAQAQQQQLLAYNQQQQDTFNSQISANNSQITKLKQAQAAELARRYGSSGGTVGGGGYPWGNAVCIHTGKVGGPCSNYDWAMNGSIWNYQTGGYGYRNCTDYVAWRIGAPSGLGNARDWPENAANKYNIGSSSTPRPGDAAVDQSGYYGHVMYVESVSADGIVVSDYNRIGDGLYRMTSLTKVGDGLYKSSTGVTSRLIFVHF